MPYTPYTWADDAAGGTPITAARLNAIEKGIASRLPVIDVVQDHGAKVDGTTDDTAAWQAALTAAGTAGGARIISSKVGVSVIAGALTDTTGANSQLKLPSIDYADSENITIVIEGAMPPPNVASVIGATPLPDGALVLKSTLASGTGALLGAYGPAGTLNNFTNVTLRIENVAFRMPANPTNSALDLRRVACVDLDNVVIDAGSYNVDGISAQTTATSFGLRLPSNNNGAHVRLGQVDVIGFYNGFEYSEHSFGEYVAAWGCKVAHTFVAANHASKFQRLAQYHCQKGIAFTGTHYVDIDQYDIEHAASGTWVPTNDIDDASNYGVGYVWWHVVKAGVGIDSTFTKSGAAGLQVNRIGTALGGGGSSLTVQDENANVSTAVTQIDFQGAGVTTTAGTGEVIVTIPGGSGGLTVQDENANVATGVSQIDFQGAGVSVASGTGEVVVTIPGGGGASPTYSAYTPALTASTTNPTLGTGGTIVGRYTQVGNLVIGWIYITFGSSGVGVGSGTYYLSLPVASATAGGGRPMGNGGFYRSSSPGLCGTFSASQFSASTVQMIYTNNAGGGVITNGAPFAWAAGDNIYLNFVYEAA